MKSPEDRAMVLEELRSLMGDLMRICNGCCDNDLGCDAVEEVKYWRKGDLVDLKSRALRVEVYFKEKYQDRMTISKNDGPGVVC